MASTRRRESTEPPSRFDPEEIADRIDKARERAGLTVPQLAAELWPEQGANARFSWYKKVARRGSSFELWEIDRVCAILPRLNPSVDPPPGWPFIDWDYANALFLLNSKR